MKLGMWELKSQDASSKSRDLEAQFEHLQERRSLGVGGWVGGGTCDMSCSASPRCRTYYLNTYLLSADLPTYSQELLGVSEVSEVVERCIEQQLALRRMKQARRSTTCRYECEYVYEYKEQ